VPAAELPAETYVPCAKTGRPFLVSKVGSTRLAAQPVLLPDSSISLEKRACKPVPPREGATDMFKRSLAAAFVAPGCLARWELAGLPGSI